MMLMGKFLLSCFEITKEITFPSLEKEMATHSSILAWRIPWMEELGGLQSTGRKELDTTERLHFHYGPFSMHVIFLAGILFSN